MGYPHSFLNDISLGAIEPASAVSLDSEEGYYSSASFDLISVRSSRRG